MEQKLSLVEELESYVNSQFDLPLDAEPPDEEVTHRMQKVQWDLISKVGNMEAFLKQLGQLIRSAIDYVIDAPTLQRYAISEIDPDEKTAIGKRIERLMKYEFDLVTGNRLDVVLGGEDVDIKTTMGKNWMFSKSSHNHLNLLIAYDETKAVFQLGLAYVKVEQLGAHNRDRKQSLKDKESIYWIIRDQPYPPNFMARLPKEIFQKIISQKTGMKRVVELLRRVNCVAIPRHVICSVANQKDPMRRIRSNGGARDLLWDEGIIVLSGAYECDRHVSRSAIGVELLDDEMMTIPVTDARISSELKDAYSHAHQLSRPV